MLADRLRLRRRIHAAEMLRRGGVHARNRSFESEVEKLSQELERSVSRRRRRAENLPRPRYELDLPVVAKREDIARAIAANQVCVICGETGSGKTTQLPKICLELGRGVAGMIGHTQPRRIAARTVAARIAEELGTPLGPHPGPVGYKVRFGDKTGPDTYIKVMTDGILLAETQGDRWLEQYDTIIIDEAHERSLNIDFLLGYLRQLLPRRPELKVIITSATIDPQRFASHFDVSGRPAPIVEVSGRTYPVEVRYRPRASDDPDDLERDQEAGILAAVDELAAMDRGDILIFLAGEREIRQTAEALRKHHPVGTEILPLFARLSAAEQMRVFQPHQNRRIVLATNVAETSLTVPGIKYVIDPGFARISRYGHRTKVQRLPIEPVSRASADQRKGRCGRVQAGVCIRLYAEDDYLARPQFTDPEILRTNLASVILQMKSLRLGDVEAFPFVEPPDSRMIKDGYETLHELGAIDDQNELTRLGAQLAKLPIDPRVGRMILEANKEGCLSEVLVIAAALSVQDPRERPMNAQDAADQAHARYKDEHSDFVWLLNLWNEYQKQGEHLSSSKLKRWCQQGFLSFMRMREWEDIHQQLHGLVADMGFHPSSRPTDYASLHRALLSGLLANIGTRAETFEYAGARGSKFHIFPGSGLFKKGPKWVAAAEIVQTTRLYARTVAKIEPEWIEALAGHLVKRSYFDAHWSKEGGQVMAFEKVQLFGVELVARRRVSYGPVEPAKAREIFIHHALVEGDTRTRMPFLEHNLELIAEVRTLEAKARRQDILADLKAIHAFYDQRLPAEVCSIALLEKWRKQAERENPRLLYMRREDLMTRDAADVTPETFPDAVAVAGTRLNLEYVLDPGGPTDGITVTVPIEALLAVDEKRGEWLVPGLLKEKILALFRCMPKAYRKLMDPAPALAEQCAAAMKFGAGDLYEMLTSTIKQLRNVQVAREAWQPRGIPDHLRMNYLVVDERGKELARGRDLTDLKTRLAGKAKASFGKLAQSAADRDGLTTWDFGPLAERSEIDRGGIRLVAYPALIDQQTSVSLRMLDSEQAATEATHLGLRRLFMLAARDELVYHLRLITDMPQMALLYAEQGGAERLKQELTELAAERAFLSAGDGPIRDKAAFDARLSAGWKRIGPAMKEASGLLREILAARHTLVVKLSERTPPAWAATVADIRDQVARLTPKGFIAGTPYEQLKHLPRYLNAARIRLEKLQNAGLQRDARWLAELQPFWQRYVQRAASAVQDPALRNYRWMLEEFRVSLFAQELGTAAPVSVKRLEEQWAKVKA